MDLVKRFICLPLLTLVLRLIDLSEKEPYSSFEISDLYVMFDLIKT